MVVRIHLSKLEEIKLKINKFLTYKNCTLRQMQSLIGSLNFACRAILPGRPFCRRLINATCDLTQPHHYLPITRGIRKDLELWLQCLREFNRVSVFQDRLWIASEDIQLFMDSAGSSNLGFDAYIGTK